jgi:hypothetical protein
MNSAYLVVAGVCLVCLVVRTGYELLKERKQVNTRNKAIFAAVFVAMCLMLSSWPGMALADPSRAALSGLGTARSIGPTASEPGSDTAPFRAFSPELILSVQPGIRIHSIRR